MEREPIELECSECQRRNYSTTKNTRKKKEKLQVRKYCKWCRKHTIHKEVK
ncbi:50S ribosomal protein L33 [bacterium HR19]|jgi:large subunit ribosomal protein L33|nr:50S ribosomal protein L33 [bacterium HR19]